MAPSVLLRKDSNYEQLAQRVAEAPGGNLRSLKMKLISTCNHRCVIWRYWRIPRCSLPLPVFQQVFIDAAALRYLKVHFSGGEVTPYPDLVHIICSENKLRLRVNITTNATLLDRNIAQKWIHAGLHAVSVFLDGGTMEVRDHIRGVYDAFNQTIKGIRQLTRQRNRLRSRIRLRINTVLQRNNLSPSPDIIRLAAEFGACDVIPMPVDGASAVHHSISEIQAYNESVAPVVNRLRLRYSFSVSNESIFPFCCSIDQISLARTGQYSGGYYSKYLCFAPWIHTFITHLGDLFACSMTAERMHSLNYVLEIPLREIFHSAQYSAYRQERRYHRLTICQDCD